MDILFIMDPLEKLDPEWDNSMFVGAELLRRGHKLWAADSPDLFTRKNVLFCHALRLAPGPDKKKFFGVRGRGKTLRKAGSFDLILVRKNPPFDGTYLALTHLLDFAAGKTAVVNRPMGIRNANEKLAILNFPQWIPETMVSASAAEILRFQKKIKGEVVVKPLSEKGGEGVFLLAQKGGLQRLKRAAQGGKKFLMAQRRVRGTEKRILVLNGKFLCAYEKRPAKKEFRANLDLGGTFHPTRLTAREKKMLHALRPYLLREGLYFAGIDVLGEKLIEINVTSSAGISETKFLHPELRPEASWAGFLENFARNFRR